jgi:hypothetical protein
MALYAAGGVANNLQYVTPSFRDMGRAVRNFFKSLVDFEEPGFSAGQDSLRSTGDSSSNPVK